MKKVLSIILVLSMVFAFAACTKKEEETKVGPGAYVTAVGANGEIVAAYKFVEFVDADKDGKNNTVFDVLTAAHKAFSKGGEADFGTYDSEYGKSINKLWGVETTAVGYYVNNAMAMGLTDVVPENGLVVAYVYQDQTYWSDSYAFFDVNTAENGATLTLSAAGYDANWNPVVGPCAGAVITVDGVATTVVTDADGHATVNITGAGEHVVSATLEGSLLVPPICVVTVK